MLKKNAFDVITVCIGQDNDTGYLTTDPNFQPLLHVFVQAQLARK